MLSTEPLTLGAGIGCSAAPRRAAEVSVGVKERKRMLFFLRLLFLPKGSTIFTVTVVTDERLLSPCHINLIYYCSCSILQQLLRPRSYLLPAPEDVHLLHLVSSPQTSADRGGLLSARSLEKQPRDGRKLQALDIFLLKG